MSFFTLAGPDIGVRRLDMSELMKELGEDAAVDAAMALADAPLHLVPGSDPPRAVRHWRDGDQALGWKWFERKLGPEAKAAEAPPRPGAVPPGFDEETDTRPERPPADQSEPRVFDRSAQDLQTLHEKGRAKFHRAKLVLKVEIPVGMFVRCQDPDRVGQVVERYARNQEFDPGTGVMFDPSQALAQALALLAKHKSFDGAGWTLEFRESSPLGPAGSRVLLEHLLAVDHAQFREETELNVDRMMGILGLTAVVSRGIPDEE